MVPVLIIEVKLDRKVVGPKFYGVMAISSTQYAEHKSNENARARDGTFTGWSGMV